MQTVSHSNADKWYNLNLGKGREFMFKHGEFFAMEVSNPNERKKYRLYGRVTEALMQDVVFNDLLSSGRCQVIFELTPEEREHIYNNCY
jgi:hypothetical protein